MTKFQKPTILERIYQTPVILACDYFEKSHELANLTDCFPFISICNIPLIQIIVRDLLKQGFYNFIICSKNNKYEAKIKDLLDHTFAIKFKISFLYGDSMGDIFRTIDQLDYNYESFFIYPINLFTITNFRAMLETYFRSKDKDPNVIMSIHMFKRAESTKAFSLYHIKDGEVTFYDKFTGKERARPEFFDMIEENKKITITRDYLGPEICIITREMLPLFTDNYDFFHVSDLMKYIFSCNIFGYRVLTYNEEKPVLEKLPFRMSEVDISALNIDLPVHFNVINNMKDYFDLNNAFVNNPMYKDNIFKMRILMDEKKYKYSEEKNSALLREFNKRKICIEGRENINNSCVGTNVNIDNVTVQNCIIGNNCKIFGSLDNCIVFDNVEIYESYSNVIIIDQDNIVDQFVFEESSEEEESEVVEDVVQQQTNFHDETLVYLQDVINDVIANKVELSVVKTQLNLFTIVWKAKGNEVIDLFKDFIINYVTEDDIDQSTLNVSFLFPILFGYLSNREDQKKFVVDIYEGLNIKGKKNKKQALFRICFALVDDGIVEKDVLNETKIFKGNLF